MVVSIVIAGESRCSVFAQICMVAEHFAQNLPTFCYERIEKSVLEWESWVFKINAKNKWHHMGSPFVWKELLMKGSRPYYIGGASQFLEYCHSYYQLDTFLSQEKFDGLVQNNVQLVNKVKNENKILTKTTKIENPEKNCYVVCISGASHPMTMNIISGLLDMVQGEKDIISKIYLYDEQCSYTFMEYVELECSYIENNCPGRIVKHVEKIGVALTHCDMLIVLDHVPFDIEASIGDWLDANRKVILNLSRMINISANKHMRVLFPNVGPACYNATILADAVSFISKNNIVVATSDLALEIAATIAEMTKVPIRNMFCSPVWGFVGINHLVDVNSIIHKHDSFFPYKRYIKVKKSTLSIGSITPEMRTLEYLMYFDTALWLKIAQNKTKYQNQELTKCKSKAVLDIVFLWLFESHSDNIVNLGIQCDGSFGLTFKGVFSQPARFVNNVWVPAHDFMLPKDPQVKLCYLNEMAEKVMLLRKNDLPRIIPFYPCICNKKYYKKKEVWGLKLKSNSVLP